MHHEHEYLHLGTYLATKPRWVDSGLTSCPLAHELATWEHAVGKIWIGTKIGELGWDALIQNLEVCVGKVQAGVAVQAVEFGCRHGRGQTGFGCGAALGGHHLD